MQKSVAGGQLPFRFLVIISDKNRKLDVHYPSTWRAAHRVLIEKEKPDEEFKWMR